MRKKILLFPFFFLFFIPAVAQLPSNPIGLNPYRLKWNQINTDKVQVIFPQGLEAEGNRVANMVHYLWDNSNESVGNQMRKVSILLQNQTTIPNGFVTVGPFRSEFFMTPPQFNNNGASNWLDLLAIHEYRHVKQFSNANKGITRLAKTLFGSWAWGGFAGLALPRWYWEGDATLSETTLSSGGRGRLPEFDMEYKALIRNGLRYNYEKASAGSLRDFVPNHYNLGYYLTAYARRNFGEDIWKNVLEDAVRYKGIFHPFSRNLRKHTGLRTRDLYAKTWEDLDKMWKAEAEQLKLTSSKKINQTPKRTFTNYRNAQYLADGSIIAEKSSFERIRAFYLIDTTGKETLLTLPGINVSANTTLSVAQNTLCWAELGYGARWGYQDYSIIKTYDYLNYKKNKITSRSRYFAPALSADASKIVAVEVTEGLKYNLVILNAQSGEVIQKLKNPENYFLSFPRFTDKSESVIVVAQKGETNLIQEVRLTDETIENLTEPSTYQISNPFPKGDYVYFSGAHTGINNIFALQISTKQIYQLTSVELGAFQPAVSKDGKLLIYSNFTAKGYDLEEITLNPDTWQLYSPQTPNTLNYFQPIAEKEGGSIIAKVPTQNFEVKKYNKWSGIINPHSFVPYLFPPEVGLRLLADNKFSTLSAEAGFTYNNNEDEWTYNVNASYAELFPVINVGYTRSNRTRSYADFQPIRNDSIAFSFFNQSWQENDLSIGLALPLNLTSGTFFRNLRLSADWHFLDLQFESIVENPNLDYDTLRATPSRFTQLFVPPLQRGVTQALDLRFRFSQQQITAIQNINPRIAQFIEFRYLTTLGNNDNQGRTIYFRSDLFFPGFKRNHSFFVNIAYQYEKYVNNYKFRNLFFYSRGFDTSPISDNLFKVGLNYTLPLALPDWKLGGLVFIKRIKANLFWDYTTFNAPSIQPLILRLNSMTSAGVELTFDIRLLRLLEVDLGVRYSYLLDNAASFSSTGLPYRFEFLLLRIGI